MPLLYLVMEYAEEVLSQVLPQRPLTPAEAAELLPPMLDALTYLHGKGLVHGRIKPSNVLAVGDQLKISADQMASPAELGLARRRRDVYDAPETAAGVVSPAGDLWSVGVTLVEALTQDVAFAAQVAQADLRLQATIPEPFRGIARQCLQLDPRRRGSIDEIRARLQSPARSVPVTPQATLKPPASVRHYRYTWRMLIPIAVLLAFGLGVRLFRSIFPHGTSGGERQIKIEAAPTPSPSQLPAAPPRTEGSVLRQVLPDVPQSAKDTITGTIRVSVRVEVDSSGKVTAAEFASPGPSRYFANLAQKAAQRWEFSPPEAGGQPAASVWLLRFRFRQDSTQVTPERIAR
jgi:TonB family protein